MKNGIYREDDHLVYYKDDKPTHAGVVKIEDKIYYIGSHGYVVKGQKNVHREMCNGILERGTYTFDENGVLVAGSYVRPTSSGKRRNDRRHKKTNAKNIRVFKKHIQKAVCLVAGIVLMLTGAFWMDKLSITAENFDDKQYTVDQSQDIHLPTIENEVLLCTDVAKAQQDGEITLIDAVRFGSPYMPFIYEYTLDQNSGIFLLSEYPDFRKSNEYVLFPERQKLTIDNLKTGTQYFYKIILEEKEYHGTFKTAETTRYVNMPGTYNTRDIGGYKTLDGKTIKQGMVIRGTEIDGLVEKGFFLDADAVENVCDTFGFKFDMDLRAGGTFSGEYNSRLNNIRHKFYSAPQYGQIFSVTYKESLKSIFNDLANPENYPMYLHCTYGADRTGTVIYLLYGILNMSEEDMLLEYQRTGYYSYTYAHSNMDVIKAGLELYEGETLQEKIVTFLTSEIGVTEMQIAGIREILLEE